VSNISDLGISQLFILKELIRGPKMTRELIEATQYAGLSRGRSSIHVKLRALNRQGFITSIKADNPKCYTIAPQRHEITKEGRRAYSVVAMDAETVKQRCDEIDQALKEPTCKA
jgi:DNA-binding PadR family transcriptional regulator